MENEELEMENESFYHLSSNNDKFTINVKEQLDMEKGILAMENESFYHLSTLKNGRKIKKSRK